MDTERRHFPRKKPDTLALVALLPESGGVVADLSEGGLGFCTSVEVERTGPIQCWFSLEAFERLEAVGELVWLDAAKKAGGLKFVELPEATRVRIRTWLGEARVAVAPGRSVAAETGIRHESAPAACEGQSARIFAPLAGAPQRAAKTRSASTLIPSAFSFTATTPEESAAWELEEEPRGGWARGIAVFILICAVLGGGGWLYYRRTHLPAEQAGAPPQVQSAQANPAGPNAVPPAQPGATIPESNAPPTAAPAPAKTEPPEQPDNTSPAAVTPAARRPAPKATPVPAPGASDLAMAQEYLRGVNRPRNSAAAVPWLWNAIRKGNDAAEVALADLFINGDGVEKNCAQARVLLMAASKKGNAAAQQKLAELKQRGCP